jgi:hypothetical protein
LWTKNLDRIPGLVDIDHRPVNRTYGVVEMTLILKSFIDITLLVFIGPLNELGL